MKRLSSCQGDKNPNWKGGRLTKTNGYIIVLSINHPYYSIDGYVLEHRLVMEKHLGRILLPTEVVHHINNGKTDNRIKNLMLFPSISEHIKHHHILKALFNKKGGKQNGKKQIGSI
jgi:hypothetical protein